MKWHTTYALPISVATRQNGWDTAELNFDAHHLSKVDFNREVAAIQNRLPNRDLHIDRNKSGDVVHITFDGKPIY